MKHLVKFIYSEKATKFCEIFTLLLTGTTLDKSKVKISQNFVAFSEYMNFKYSEWNDRKWKNENRLVEWIFLHLTKFFGEEKFSLLHSKYNMADENLHFQRHANFLIKLQCLV